MTGQEHALWVVAIAAGAFSFLSPCVLPLIPGYLSMISGLSVEQLEQHTGRHLLRVFVACALFAVGLCVVFIPLGLGFGALGRWLGPHLRLLNIALGLVVVVFGLAMMSVIKIPFLYQDRRLRLGQGATGLWAAPLLGMAFGAGWTPCLGYWVGLLSTQAANLPPAEAGRLFAIYGISLGACFTAAGVLFAWAIKAISFFQRRYRTIELAGGFLLVAMGLLMVTDQWTAVSGLLMRLTG
jgi:cytochrome c-type biogenesis protein